MSLNADNGKYGFKQFITPGVGQILLANFPRVWSPIHKFIYRYPKKIDFGYPFNRSVVNFKLRNITISHDFLVVLFICI